MKKGKIGREGKIVSFHVVGDAGITTGIGKLAFIQSMMQQSVVE